jgi:hypothetical protein
VSLRIPAAEAVIQTYACLPAPARAVHRAQTAGAVVNVGVKDKIVFELVVCLKDNIYFIA